MSQMVDGTIFSILGLELAKKEMRPSEFEAFVQIESPKISTEIEIHPMNLELNGFRQRPTIKISFRCFFVLSWELPGHM